MSARTFALVVAMSLSPTFAQSPQQPPAPAAPAAAANAPTPAGTTVAPPSTAAIDPAGLPGTRMLGGGGKLPPRVYEHFLQLAGGPEKARIVLIPTASASVDDEAGRQKVLQRWQQEHPGYRFEVLHTRDRATADDEALTAPLRTATGVWLGGGVQKKLAEAYLGTRVERELQALLARGGVVGGTSAGTAIQTRTMIQEGKEDPVVATGFDFVPFAISDQHFLKRQRLPRLLQVLGEHPGHFGIGVDEGTAVVVSARSLQVLGDSKALLVLPAAAGREQQVVELAEGQGVDLVAWQRSARARTGTPWPPTPMATPQVANGTLLLAGGGPLPPELVARFVERAGGKAAKVVVVGGAMPPGERDDEPFVRLLQQHGVADVRTLVLRHPREVTASELAKLASATGVWFGGGRQWRFVDAYDGTEALAAFHAVLARGGVIGGTSAGATIQGEFLVRGNPLGNTEVWCEGYERGFGFLPGCAVDQHFVVRNREGDLRALVEKLPQLLGLGIDEGTALEVRGSLATVLGTGKVAVFDARRERSKLAAQWLAAGDTFDLAAGVLTSR